MAPLENTCPPALQLLVSNKVNPRRICHLSMVCTSCGCGLQHSSFPTNNNYAPRTPCWLFDWFLLGHRWGKPTETTYWPCWYLLNGTFKSIHASPFVAIIFREGLEQSLMKSSASGHFPRHCSSCQWRLVLWWKDLWPVRPEHRPGARLQVDATDGFLCEPIAANVDPGGLYWNVLVFILVVRPYIYIIYICIYISIYHVEYQMWYNIYIYGMFTTVFNWWFGFRWPIHSISVHSFWGSLWGREIRNRSTSNGPQSYKLCPQTENLL